MKKIRIYDKEFGHAKSISGEEVPALVEWVRDGPATETCFFTERCLEMASGVSCKTKVAWLIEPQSYESIIGLENSFDFILSHNKNLNVPDSKRLFYPFAGCWIPKSESSHEVVKTGLVSMLSSNKAGREGYDMRHSIADKFGDRIDMFGGIVGRPIKNKADAISPYRYTVAIENCRMDDYFTEKIIDCFALGTIPIYWGTKNISKYFNTDGIIQFDSIEDFNAILDSLSLPCKKMMDSARENYMNHFNYRCSDDWIFSNYRFL